MSGGDSGRSGRNGNRYWSRHCARSIQMSSRCKEVWATEETTQAHEFAASLGLHAGFAEPSYPAVPDPPQVSDHDRVTLGLGVLGRWPITACSRWRRRPRHRSWVPLALTATLAHPAGPLPIVVGCWSTRPPTTMIELPKHEALAELATDPIMDGPCPVIVAGDLNAAPGSAVLRPLQDRAHRRLDRRRRRPAAVTLPSSHPSAPSRPAPSLLINELITSSFGQVSRVCRFWSSRHR